MPESPQEPPAQENGSKGDKAAEEEAVLLNEDPLATRRPKFQVRNLPPGVVPRWGDK